jgi:hypothetical protein
MTFTNTDCVGKVVSCDLDSQVEGQMYHWEWWRAHNYFFSFTFAKKEIVVYYIKETFL